MTISIDGLPDDVKEKLENEARRKGRTLNAHVVAILSRHAGEFGSTRELVQAFAGTVTWEEVLEGRRLEKENALDWSMNYDGPPRR